VGLRASLLDAESLISGDKYTFIRDAYLQRRNYLAKDGDVEDDFGDDLDGEGF
jgi:phospholipid-binding lipoprotein MlaA